MKKEDMFKLFGIDDLRDLPDAVTKIIDGDLNDRNEIYKELIRLNDNDMSHDWFQELYESELSERKQKKTRFHAQFSRNSMLGINRATWTRSRANRRERFNDNR